MALLGVYQIIIHQIIMPLPIIVAWYFDIVFAKMQHPDNDNIPIKNPTFPTMYEWTESITHSQRSPSKRKDKHHKSPKMDRWIGKVAVVTGAGGGIGSAIVLDLLRAGLTVVGIDQQVERVELLRNQLSTTSTGTLYLHKCDLTVEADIVAAFAWIERTLGGIDILVNGGGVMEKFKLTDANNTVQLRRILDTNVLATVLCTREAFKSMQARNVAGHVVCMNSVTGHSVVQMYGYSNMYTPSKHAITAITEVLRQEFNEAQSNIKITVTLKPLGLFSILLSLVWFSYSQSLSPGLVDTPLIPADLRALPAMKFLQPEDVSSAIMYAISTPPHVQVHKLTIKPVGEYFWMD